MTLPGLIFFLAATNLFVINTRSFRARRDPSTRLNTMVKTADTVNAKKVGIARLKAMFGLIPVLFIRLATMNCPQ